MLATQAPFPQYLDTDGSPLAGNLWFGTANGNPETSPITVYWDAAGTQPASQPISVKNGFSMRIGTPAAVYVATDYSLTAKNAKGALAVYAASGAAYSGALALATDLASTASGKGAALVGFNGSLTYAANTTGKAIADREWCVTDYPWLADGTGATDCTTAVQACVTAAPAGTTIRFPSGQTFKFNASTVGAQVTIAKSLHFDATGATFTITATASPTNWSQERHNAIFRLSQVTGFSWKGGVVNGGRGNATVPMVGFIVGHGCKNVTIDGLVVNDLDHNSGSIAFDAVSTDFVTNVAQQNIKVLNCGFVRCYYGVYLRGTVNGLLVQGCWGKDFDLQDPQTGYARLGSNQYGGVPVGIYGFDGNATSATGPQRGVRVIGNDFDGMTQGPVGYNYESNTYTSSSTYACQDIVFAGNTVTRVLTGIHCNGWEQSEVTGNTVRRLSMSSTATYGGTYRISSTAAMSGSGIEVSTAGRRVSAVGNNVLSYWPLDGSTDYSGGFTGIDIGATSNSTETATAGVLSGNQVSGCYIGLRPTGNVLAHIEGNRVDNCRRAFENDAAPLNGGAFAEGAFIGNTIRLNGYTGTKIGLVFRGAWHVSGNTIIGDSGAAYDYAVQMTPGAKTCTFTNNTITNAVEALLLTQSGSTTFVEDNRFIGVSYAVEVGKDATSTLHVRKNYLGSTTSAIFFSGAGSHGTYYGDNNTMPAGTWSNDGAAVFPSQLGYRSSNPNGSGTYSLGCSFLNSAPASAGFVGWVCTTQPNTFKTFGLIS